MKLHHLALTIQNEDELHKFYENILDFHLVREFKLEADWSSKIFNINKSAQAFYLEGHGLALELFIDEEKKQHSFNHYCLSFPDRESFVKKAKANKAIVVRIPRGSNDLIFIKDLSGNVFEIKEDIKD
ncbi:MAG: hypothetical protein DRI74_00470 [Bacteroidetes bacterium]|nr:MAG: hypothetical protein DRI74_00470 [Bacteroidota bacterium]